MHRKLIFTVYLTYKMAFAMRYELSLSTTLNLQSREVFWSNQHSPGVPDAQFLSLSSHLPDPDIINDFLEGLIYVCVCLLSIHWGASIDLLFDCIPTLFTIKSNVNICYSNIFIEIFFLKSLILKYKMRTLFFC